VNISINIKPTLFKISIPAILLIGSPWPDIGIGFLIYNILWVPFSFFLNSPPFTYRDITSYVAPLGALVASVFWGLLFYFICSLQLKRIVGSLWWGKHIFEVLAVAVLLLYFIGVLIYIV
jgi:hypothetical protein